MIAIGIDSGTQSTKVLALDVVSGECIATAQEAYGLLAGLPAGHMEQWPATWHDAAETALRRCLDALGARRREIAAIGVSGQQHGLVVLNAKDEPVRAAKLWNDTSTAPQCATLHKALGGREEVIKLAGNPMLPGYTAPKILWLKQHEPQNYAVTRTILLPHDYLNFRLTGEKLMEYGDASGTALLDVRTRKWRREILEAIDSDLAAKLPPLQSSRRPSGLLRSVLAKEWDLPGDIVVSAGGGDNMMAAIGTGNVKPGVLTASLGTSGTLFACSESPVIDPGGEAAAFCDSTDRWLPLVCTMNVTVATECVSRLFGMDHDALDESVQASAAGAGGLLFLPYLTGERTPDLPRASGVLHGLSPQNFVPANMARAVMEGVTLGLRYGLKRLAELGVVPSEIRLTGGGSRSRVWRQLAADVFGVPTVCLSTAEGAALGAAIQAAVTVGVTRGGRYETELETLAERCVASEETTRCFPDPARATFYAELAERQTQLTRKLAAAGFL